MNPQRTVFEIKSGERFTFEFVHTKIMSVSDRKILLEYDGTQLATLKYRPQFPNGILSLDFSNFHNIQSFGLFKGLNNGFDFITHPRMWVPYEYENNRDPSNPIYSVQYKIKQMGFDTICINCDKKEMWVEIYCYSQIGDLCIVLSDLHMYY